ncbi:uncharacterized protein PV07_08864 [Cladophialophora immunda]|uniref:Uncharacterized protein n=1 Tax=Cladophialophora immunda TaxID=569365 RepID=A0A0D2AL21_9EURO|nr:uncharacterized protein PV07_08864 [Cladophialophora immunda]KIW25707.1 hypothetical protein PV07_08864 [Cladophialophora immunda]
MSSTISRSLAGRKARRRRSRVHSLAIDGNDCMRQDNIVVEIPTSTARAATMTSSSDPIPSLGQHVDFRQRFEEEINTFATSLVHREPKYVPSHQEDALAMARIDSSCETAIDHWMLAQSFGCVKATDLTEGAIELCQLLVGVDGCEETRKVLETLSAHESVSPKNFLRGLCAGAITRWVYLDTKPQLPSVCQYPQSDVLRSVLAATPNIYRRLVDAMTLEYLERHFATTIPALSKELTKRLHTILTNFRGLKSANTLTDLSDHINNFRVWERYMADAFEGALRLRLNHLRSPMKYNYTFPSSGQPFVEDKMISLYSEASRRRPHQVWLCLSPLIESWNESMDSSSHVIISPARVISS